MDYMNLAGSAVKVSCVPSEYMPHAIAIRPVGPNGAGRVLAWLSGRTLSFCDKHIPEVRNCTLELAGRIVTAMVVGG